MKEQIKRAFEKVTGRDLDDYEWDLSLEGDLDMDGLDFVEFIMCLESQLQISIHDDTAESLYTPNQWLAYLNSISKVAILKESTPSTEQHSIRCASYTSEGLQKPGHVPGECDCHLSKAEQESQEELWWIVIDYIHSHTHDELEVSKLMKKFTITRKP